MNPKTIAIVSAVAVIGGFNASAGDDPGNFYVHADVGPSFVQDINLTAGPRSQTLRLDPGVRGDLALGYNFCDSWAAEIEVGVAQNTINGIGNATITDSDLRQIPVLANVVYKINLAPQFTAYLGVGAGGDFTRAETDVFDSLNGLFQRSVNNDVAFAFQGTAGMAYSLSPHARVDLGYKFLGTLDRHWFIGGLGGNPVVEGEALSTGLIYTHAVVLSFSWSF